MIENTTPADDSLYLASIYRIHATIFVESARTLAERLEANSAGTPTKLTAIPFYLLTSHAAELFLKSALLKRGFGDRDLRQFNYRHNLSVLLSAVKQKGVRVSATTDEMVGHSLALNTKTRSRPIWCICHPWTVGTAG